MLAGLWFSFHRQLGVCRTKRAGLTFAFSLVTTGQTAHPHVEAKVRHLVGRVLRNERAEWVHSAQAHTISPLLLYRKSCRACTHLKCPKARRRGGGHRHPSALWPYIPGLVPFSPWAPTINNPSKPVRCLHASLQLSRTLRHPQTITRSKVMARRRQSGCEGLVRAGPAYDGPTVRRSNPVLEGRARL